MCVSVPGSGREHQLSCCSSETAHPNVLPSKSRITERTSHVRVGWRCKDLRCQWLLVEVEVLMISYQFIMPGVVAGRLLLQGLVMSFRKAVAQTGRCLPDLLCCKCFLVNIMK